MVLPGKATSTFSLWDVNSIELLKDVVEDLLGDWCTNSFHEISDEGLYYAIDNESSLLDSIDDTIDNTITTITEQVKNLNSSASNVLRQATATISNTAQEPTVQEAMATGISAVKDTWSMFRSFTNATLQAMAPPPEDEDGDPADAHGVHMGSGALAEEPALPEQLTPEKSAQVANTPGPQETASVSEEATEPTDAPEEQLPSPATDSEAASLAAVNSPTGPVDDPPAPHDTPAEEVNEAAEADPDGEANSSGSSYVEVPSKASSVTADKEDDDDVDDDEWINT